MHQSNVFASDSVVSLRFNYSPKALAAVSSAQGLPNTVAWPQFNRNSAHIPEIAYVSDRRSVYGTIDHKTSPF